jgi:hypothetical protein
MATLLGFLLLAYLALTAAGAFAFKFTRRAPPENAAKLPKVLRESRGP